MVFMTTGKGEHREYLPNELVGIGEPSVFISALLHYTSKEMKRQEAASKVLAVSATAPVDSLARRIKAGSLNPSIYQGNRY